MKNRLALLLLILTLGACAHREMICGVPVQGTPWELAARIHDHGNGTFLPECVDMCGQSKAFICGWSLPTEQPDTIFCDLIEGRVVSAHLFTPIIDK